MFDLHHGWVRGHPVAWPDFFTSVCSGNIITVLVSEEPVTSAGAEFIATRLAATSSSNNEMNKTNNNNSNGCQGDDSLRRSSSSVAGSGGGSGQLLPDIGVVLCALPWGRDVSLDRDELRPYTLTTITNSQQGEESRRNVFVIACCGPPQVEINAAALASMSSSATFHRWGIAVTSRDSFVLVATSPPSRVLSQTYCLLEQGKGGQHNFLTSTTLSGTQLRRGLSSASNPSFLRRGSSVSPHRVISTSGLQEFEGYSLRNTIHQTALVASACDLSGAVFPREHSVLTDCVLDTVPRNWAQAKEEATMSDYELSPVPSSASSDSELMNGVLYMCADRRRVVCTSPKVRAHVTSPSGRFEAIGYSDGSVDVVSCAGAAKASTVLSLPGQGRDCPVRGIALSETQIAVSYGDSIIMLFSTLIHRTGHSTERGQIEEDGVLQIDDEDTSLIYVRPTICDFAAPSLLAIGCDDGSIALADIEECDVCDTVSAHDGFAIVRLQQTGRYLIALAAEGSVSVLDVLDGTTQSSADISVLQVIHPDAKTLSATMGSVPAFVCVTSTGMMSLYGGPHPFEPVAVRLEQPLLSAALSRDAHELFLINRRGETLKLSTHYLIDRYGTRGHVGGVDVVCIGEAPYAYSGGAEDGVVVVWDAQTCNSVTRFNVASSPVVALAASLDRLVVCTQHGTVVLYDTHRIRDPARREVRTLARTTRDTLGCGFVTHKNENEAGDFYVYVVSKTALRVWDAVSGKNISVCKCLAREPVGVCGGFHCRLGPTLLVLCIDAGEEGTIEEKALVLEERLLCDLDVLLRDVVVPCEDTSKINCTTMCHAHDEPSLFLCPDGVTLFRITESMTQTRTYEGATETIVLPALVISVFGRVSKVKTTFTSSPVKSYMSSDALDSAHPQEDEPAQQCHVEEREVVDEESVVLATFSVCPRESSTTRLLAIDTKGNAFFISRGPTTPAKQMTTTPLLISPTAPLAAKRTPSVRRKSWFTSSATPTAVLQHVFVAADWGREDIAVVSTTRGEVVVLTNAETARAEDAVCTMEGSDRLVFLHLMT